MPHEHLVETKVTFECAWASDEHHTKQPACRCQQARELRERQPSIEPVARERRDTAVPGPKAKDTSNIGGGDDPDIGAKQRRRARTSQSSCRATQWGAGPWSFTGLKWHGDSEHFSCKRRVRARQTSSQDVESRWRMATAVYNAIPDTIACSSNTTRLLWFGAAVAGFLPADVPPRNIIDPGTASST